MSSLQFDPRTVTLSSGKHSGPDNGTCIMEAETVFWGLKFTDSHPCVSPVIGAFLRTWNDSLPSDAERERLLRQFIGRLAGTKATDEIELHRSWMAFDWLVRECVAEFLSLTPALKSHADLLRGLPEINQTNFDMVVPLIHSARDAAAGDAAARACAARACAARACAARACAAWACAAGDAAARACAARACAAWACAAGASAAWACAARACAAWACAARASAAGDAVNPSVSRLQESAVQLVDRMIRLTEPREVVPQRCGDRLACDVLKRAEEVK